MTRLGTVTRLMLSGQFYRLLAQVERPYARACIGVWRKILGGNSRPLEYDHVMGLFNTPTKSL